MPQEHIVQQGDTLYSIGIQYKVPWKEIYDADENREFREKRENPAILHPGDVVIIPDSDPKTKKCQTGSSYRFKKYNKQNQPKIRIKFSGLSNTEYILKYDDKEITGTTDADGVLEAAVDADLTDAVIELGGKEYTIKVNHLDPINEISGIQARLNNLGFPCGSVDGIDGPKTQSGVKRFQQAYGLAVDGIAGPNTQGKLKEVYGC